MAASGPPSVHDASVNGGIRKQSSQSVNSSLIINDTYRPKAAVNSSVRRISRIEQSQNTTFRQRKQSILNSNNTALSAHNTNVFGYPLSNINNTNGGSSSRGTDAGMIISEPPVVAYKPSLFGPSMMANKHLSQAGDEIIGGGGSS